MLRLGILLIGRRAGFRRFSKLLVSCWAAIGGDSGKIGETQRFEVRSFSNFAEVAAAVGEGVQWQ
jgi:hypothetical protein